MTYLEEYMNLSNEIEEMYETGQQLNIQNLLVYQELCYRIDVLTTLKMFCNSAPSTTELDYLFNHYQLVNQYITWLCHERLIQGQPDEKACNRRETATTLLHSIISDYRSRFQNYSPATDDQYKTDIHKIILSVLPVWIQFRESYVSIENEKENR